MSRPQSGPVVRASLAGAFAMAVFGIVEIWFTELLVVGVSPRRVRSP